MAKAKAVEICPTCENEVKEGYHCTACCCKIVVEANIKEMTGELKNQNIVIITSKKGKRDEFKTTADGAASLNAVALTHHREECAKAAFISPLPTGDD